MCEKSVTLTTSVLKNETSRGGSAINLAATVKDHHRRYFHRSYRHERHVTQKELVAAHSPLKASQCHQHPKTSAPHVAESSSNRRTCYQIQRDPMMNQLPHLLMLWANLQLVDHHPGWMMRMMSTTVPSPLPLPLQGDVARRMSFATSAPPHLLHFHLFCCGLRPR